MGREVGWWKLHKLKAFWYTSPAFYHMQDKITECWLAESEGIFSYFGNQEGMITWWWLAEHTCKTLVSRFKRILKRNFRSASLLSLISTGLLHPLLNVKDNQHATKGSLLVEKQKDFSGQKCIDSQPDKSLIGYCWCRTKHRVTELFFMAAKRGGHWGVLNTAIPQKKFEKYRNTAKKVAKYRNTSIPSQYSM